MIPETVSVAASFWSVCNITYCDDNPKHTESGGNTVIEMKSRTIVFQTIHK